MQVKILLSRSFIDKTISDQLGNVIVHSIIKPISPVLNQFKENGVIRDWSNERIVRYILALSLSYALPMMLNDNEGLDIDEAVNEIVECLSFALVEVKQILILGLLLEIVGFFKTNIKIPNQSDWGLENKLKQYLEYHRLGYILEDNNIFSCKIFSTKTVCFNSCFSCVEDLGQDVLETTRVY